VKSFKKLREQSAAKPYRLTLDYGNLQLPGEVATAGASSKSDVIRRDAAKTDPADFNLKDFTLGKRADTERKDISASNYIAFDQKVKEREAEIKSKQASTSNVRPYSSAYNDLMKNIATRSGMLQTTFTNPMSGKRETIRVPNYTSLYPEGSPERENFVEPTIQQRRQAINNFIITTQSDIQSGRLVPDAVYDQMQREAPSTEGDEQLGILRATRDTFKNQLGEETSMKTFKQLREQVGFFDALGNLFGGNKNRNNRNSSRSTSSPTTYSQLIYGRDGIEMNPPAFYDQGFPRDKSDGDDATAFEKSFRVPTSTFARKVTSGETFRVPERVRGSSTTYNDPTGLPVYPLPSNTRSGMYIWGPAKFPDIVRSGTEEKGEASPTPPNRYGIPRNPKVAQELSVYRSQQPPKIPTTYEISTDAYDTVRDLRKDFRTPEAIKAASDELDQRKAIRQSAKDLAAKNRKEREAAQSAAAGRQVRELGRMPSQVDYASKLRDAKAAIADAEKKFKMSEIERKGRAELAAQDAERAQGARDAAREAERVQKQRTQSTLAQTQSDLAASQAAAARTQADLDAARARISTQADQILSGQEMQAQLDATADQLKDVLSQNQRLNALLNQLGRN